MTWIDRVFALPDGARETYTIEGATLDVAILGLNLPDDDHPVGLRHLWVPPAQRGQGRGRAILQALIAGADRYGRPLEADLYPYEMRTGSEPATTAAVEALAQAYVRMGFTILRASRWTMPVPVAYRPRAGRGR